MNSRRSGLLPEALPIPPARRGPGLCGRCIRRSSKHLCRTVAIGCFHANLVSAGAPCVAKGRCHCRTEVHSRPGTPGSGLNRPGSIAGCGASNRPKSVHSTPSTPPRLLAQHAKSSRPLAGSSETFTHVATQVSLVSPLIHGGAEGIRTPDLLIANETRYQLRHSPVVLGPGRPANRARVRRYQSARGLSESGRLPPRSTSGEVSFRRRGRAAARSAPASRWRPRPPGRCPRRCAPSSRRRARAGRWCGPSGARAAW